MNTTPDHSGANPLEVGKLAIGSCAWSFEDWRGVFYPEHLSAHRRLDFYSKYLNSVEIDSTFYAIPTRHATSHWHAVTPENFVFCAKLPKAITHDRKLRDCEGLLEEFLGALEPLGAKLGCVLIQLPPYFCPNYDEVALRHFIHRLPTRIRFAVEFRHSGWHLPRISHLLEAHRVCWAWHDVTALDHAQEGAFEALPRTTDFLYVRLLGDMETKFGGDGSRLHRYRGLLWPRDSAMEDWALRVRQHLPQVGKAFVYANNHFEGFAPHTAQRFAELFGETLALPSEAVIAGRNPEPENQLELPMGQDSFS